MNISESETLPNPRRQRRKKKRTHNFPCQYPCQDHENKIHQARIQRWCGMTVRADRDQAV